MNTKHFVKLMSLFRTCRLFLLLLPALGSMSAHAAEIRQIDVFSKALRFEGEPVEVLRSGKTIRKFAIFRGKKYEWAGKVRNRVATPEEEFDTPEQPLDIDAMSIEDLANNLRGLALFRGHQFIEAEPAYELARTIKKRQRLEKDAASEEDLQSVLSGVAPYRGKVSSRPWRSVEPQPPKSSESTEQVHGTDDRVVMNNLSYPFRTNIVFDNTGSTATINGAEGSGTLIGPSTALSAAHVFWDEANGTWEADHIWAPGFDSKDADPSPWGDWYRCYWVTIPTAYTTNVNQNTYDYAVLDFNVGCNSVDNGVNSDRPGATVGWLGHYTASDGDIESRTAYVRGYPGLGTCGNPGQSCNVRVWGDYSSPSENDAQPQKIHHQADTTGGMSGSGIYHYADPSCGGCNYGAYLVGIHRAGSSSYNVARRYDSTVYSFMKAYSSDY